MYAYSYFMNKSRWYMNTDNLDQAFRLALWHLQTGVVRVSPLVHDRDRIYDRYLIDLYAKEQGIDFSEKTQIKFKFMKNTNAI